MINQFLCFKLKHINIIRHSIPELFAQGICIWLRHAWRLGRGGPWIRSHFLSSSSTWCRMHTSSSFEKVKKLHEGLNWQACWHVVMFFECSKLSRRSLSNRQYPCLNHYKINLRLVQNDPKSTSLIITTVPLQKYISYDSLYIARVGIGRGDSRNAFWQWRCAWKSQFITVVVQVFSRACK